MSTDEKPDLVGVQSTAERRAEESLSRELRRMAVLQRRAALDRRRRRRRPPRPLAV